MASILALLLSVATAPAAVNDPAGTPLDFELARDAEMSTTTRLMEARNSVTFRFDSPDKVMPSVAIDANSNGQVDAKVDFVVTFDDDTSAPCFQYWLAKNRTSLCGSLGDKASVSRKVVGGVATTLISFPKKIVARGGTKFGFAITLLDTRDRYERWPAGGTYTFGGTIDLVGDSPNFTGQQNQNLPAELVPAMRRYQSCLIMALKALEPVTKDKISQIQAIPGGCATVRRSAQIQAVESLTAAGYDPKDSATAASSLFNSLESNLQRFVDLVSNPR
jgi:hypothetical protein